MSATLVRSGVLVGAVLLGVLAGQRDAAGSPGCVAGQSWAGDPETPHIGHPTERHAAWTGSSESVSCAGSVSLFRRQLAGDPHEPDKGDPELPHKVAPEIRSGIRGLLRRITALALRIEMP